MHECPICRRFREMFPFVKQDPHPYYIKLADGSIYRTSAAETAIIDFDKKHAKSRVLSKTYKPEVRLV